MLPTSTTPGPELRWVYAAPTMPQVQRLVCGTCGRQARAGQDVEHSAGCLWVTRTYTKDESERTEGHEEQALGRSGDEHDRRRR
jgi:hypothetical protein